MRGGRAADVVYRYRKNHATREQLVAALTACSSPVEGCGDCIYKQMHDSSCIMHMMEDAAYELGKEIDDEHL